MNAKFDALKSLGAGDFEHLNGKLITHLEKTRDILIGWGGSSVLCDAGLYHAAYGTDGFNASMVALSRRADIANIIGIESEELVYLYCSCDRGFVFPKLGLSNDIRFRDRFLERQFSLSDEQSKLFCELTVANEMELVLDNKTFKESHGKELLILFESMKKYLSPHAIDAYRRELVTNGC